MKISEWMKQSGVAFGTSGARGLVTAMTDAVCFAYTVGYLKHLASRNEFEKGMPVAVAGDLRPSTPRILRACVAAIREMGGEAVFCGFVPTPALSLHAFGRGIPSLMVTGSHIPADRNGIKFNRARGEFLKADEAAMREQSVALPYGMFKADESLAVDIELPPVTDVVADYVERYRAFLGADALAGLNLGIYQHSAVGRDVLVQVVEALGGKAIPLGRADSFIPVDTEAVRPEDAELARQWAQEKPLHAILTTDGDSDRPLLADHAGQWLRGDVLGILAARFLGADAVTTPVSSNTALEKAGFASDVRRTRIGSPFVVEAMMAAAEAGRQPSVGYEANGGFLLASDVVRQGRKLAALPTRDAVLPMLCALVSMREQGKTHLADLLAGLPARFTLSDRLAEMPTLQSREKLQELSEAPATGARVLGFIAACGSLEQVDETDGLRMSFARGEIIHLRPSGNAPELRVYVEADSPERAAELLKLGLAAVSRWRPEA
ncbi:phosphomannomutase [Frateuria aurantia]|uniref:Phosphomannomutase n=1 Tax=Frateuria aurantia (strain ATCC 33424 / DSM 6220 / KCTC 2777 / LMG 1558 / NBRC 3245 / NCIMB 13370) TaxID=767434 RepID=H8L139_FRAAD|nr:phosphomannomutase [Frateuria aurantia]AFC87194.1 phosphomannomutase [Frateuria aurantia DSM 6220]